MQCLASCSNRCLLALSCSLLQIMHIGLYPRPQMMNMLRTVWWNMLICCWHWSSHFCVSSYDICVSFQRESDVFSACLVFFEACLMLCCLKTETSHFVLLLQVKPWVLPYLDKLRLVYIAVYSAFLLVQELWPTVWQADSHWVVGVCRWALGYCDLISSWCALFFVLMSV